MRYETTHTLLVSDYRPAAHMDEIRDDTYTVGEWLQACCTHGWDTRRHIHCWWVSERRRRSVQCVRWRRPTVTWRRRQTINILPLLLLLDHICPTLRLLNHVLLHHIASIKWWRGTICVVLWPFALTSHHCQHHITSRHSIAQQHNFNSFASEKFKSLFFSTF